MHIHLCQGFKHFNIIPKTFVIPEDFANFQGLRLHSVVATPYALPTSCSVGLLACSLGNKCRVGRTTSPSSRPHSQFPVVAYCCSQKLGVEPRLSWQQGVGCSHHALCTCMYCSVLFECSDIPQAEGRLDCEAQDSVSWSRNLPHQQCKPQSLLLQLSPLTRKHTYILSHWCNHLTLSPGWCVGRNSIVLILAFFSPGAQVGQLPRDSPAVVSQYIADPLCVDGESSTEAIAHTAVWV